MWILIGFMLPEPRKILAKLLKSTRTFWAVREVTTTVSLSTALLSLFGCPNQGAIHCFTQSRVRPIKGGFSSTIKE